LLGNVLLSDVSVFRHFAARFWAVLRRFAANAVAIRNEITELRRSIGTASYQIGEELEVFPSILGHTISALTMLRYRATSKSIPDLFS
jgi:hypothetical protein